MHVVVSAAFLAMPVAAGAGWASSYSHDLGLNYHREELLGAWNSDVVSRDGQVLGAWGRLWHRDIRRRADGWSADPEHWITGNNPIDRNLGWFTGGTTHGFGWRDNRTTMPTIYGIAVRIIVVPWWALTLMAGLPLTSRIALVGFRRRRRAARTAGGQCPACGYDLRATPGRCPECGRAGEPVPSAS